MNRKPTYTLTAKKEAKKGTMESLINGVLFGLNQKNYHIGGFNAFIQCDIPRNVGLGSSANFNIMIGTIINYLYNEGKIENKCLIQIGRFATNNVSAVWVDLLKWILGILIHLIFIS